MRSCCSWMVTCCSAGVWHHRFATKAGMPIHRSCCLECRRHLDGPKAGGHTSINLRSRLYLFFESLLRYAIAQRREADATAYGFAILIQPIQGLAWALMRPVPRSSLRVLHFMQTQQFRVPKTTSRIRGMSDVARMRSLLSSRPHPRAPNR
jgi:hypothetical protein